RSRPLEGAAPAPERAVAARRDAVLDRGQPRQPRGHDGAEQARARGRHAHRAGAGPHAPGGAARHDPPGRLRLLARLPLASPHLEPGRRRTGEHHRLRDRVPLMNTLLVERLRRHWQLPAAITVTVLFLLVHVAVFLPARGRLDRALKEARTAGVAFDP